MNFVVRTSEQIDRMLRDEENYLKNIILKLKKLGT